MAESIPPSRKVWYMGLFSRRKSESRVQVFVDTPVQTTASARHGAASANHGLPQHVVTAALIELSSTDSQLSTIHVGRLQDMLGRGYYPNQLNITRALNGWL